mmetsp:Transcript_10228/g.20999  ORF Transcript_10228/g.20999 Transcript_10228/m.20999 type:complete len:226 (+) Transcript_10228:442-1119(+)
MGSRRRQRNVAGGQLHVRSPSERRALGDRAPASADRGGGGAGAAARGGGERAGAGERERRGHADRPGCTQGRRRLSHLLRLHPYPGAREAWRCCSRRDNNHRIRRPPAPDVRDLPAVVVRGRSAESGVHQRPAESIADTASAERSVDAGVGAAGREPAGGGAQVHAPCLPGTASIVEQQHSDLSGRECGEETERGQGNLLRADPRGVSETGLTVGEAFVSHCKEF